MPRCASPTFWSRIGPVLLIAGRDFAPCLNPNIFRSPPMLHSARQALGISSHFVVALPCLMELNLQRGQFYGRVSLRREVGGSTLSETRYHAGRKLPRHSHDRSYFCFVLRGRFAEVYDNKSRAC